MKTLILIAPLLLIICFQNFNFVNLLDKKYFVDEKSRVNHAREILGKNYKKSDISKLEGEKFFHIYLYNLVNKGLPEKHKRHSNRLVKTIIAEATAHSIDPVFIASIIQTESSFNPEARGLAGEVGLMQIMPSTAKEIAERLKIRWRGPKTLLDPVNNVRIGTAYVSQLRDFFGNQPARYISAYNVGPGKILKIENKKKDLPKFYSTKVLKYYEEFYKKVVSSQLLNNLAAN
ncbi:MAG: lytic transglycosylase domain-containing protein [Bdellovibrionaceae bacterium]|nr:lytic transglycosylase domain-containing protein [Pseudobdellovibrionaceae bacterium]